MKQAQKGFSTVEAIIAVVIVVAVVGVGWFVMSRNDTKNDKVGTRIEETASYTDSSKLYSLLYPKSWTVKEAAVCCEGAPKDYTKVSRAVSFIPANADGRHGYEVSVQADATNTLAKAIEQNWKDNNHTPESKTINGYQAQYVKAQFTGDAENYIDHKYVLTNNGASVYLTFREKYYHQYPAADWSAAEHLDEFNALVASVRFLK